MSRIQRLGMKALLAGAASALLVSGIALASQPSTTRAGMTNRDLVYTTPYPIETMGGVGARSADACHLTSIRSRGSVAHFILSCPKAKRSSTFTIKLYTLKSGKQIVIAKGKLRVKAGHEKSATVELNRTGRKLLKQEHTLSAIIELSVKRSSSAPTTSSITFTSKSPKRHLHH
jgi:hypothetical protein